MPIRPLLAPLTGSWARCRGGCALLALLVALVAGARLLVAEESGAVPGTAPAPLSAALAGAAPPPAAPAPDAFDVALERRSEAVVCTTAGCGFQRLALPRGPLGIRVPPASAEAPRPSWAEEVGAPDPAPDDAAWIPSSRCAVGCGEVLHRADALRVPF